MTGDLALTHARYASDPLGGYIANSIPAVITGAATVESPGGLYGSARLRYFAAQPLTEDDSVEQPSSTMVDLQAGYRHDWYEASLQVLNLFDSRS